MQPPFLGATIIMYGSYIQLHDLVAGGESFIFSCAKIKAVFNSCHYAMTCVLEYIQYTVRRFGGGEHRHCDSLCVFYTTAISTSF